MTGDSIGRSNRRFRRQRGVFRRKCARENLPCHICKGKYGPIRYDLPDRHESGLGFNADHEIPWSLLEAGDRRRADVANLAPSHQRCNLRKSNRVGFTEVEPPSRPEGW